MELRIVNKTLGKDSQVEYLEITKMILKGDTIAQIAKSLNYSESTVSNRLSELLARYNAKNRFEFIYNFFSQIIQKYRTKLDFMQAENNKLKSATCPFYINNNCDRCKNQNL